MLSSDMSSINPQQMARRPAVVLVTLVVLAILGFSLVRHLVNRFGEQRKALSRHLYQRSLTEQRRGDSKGAIADLRSALDYDPDNFQYQLSLARLLRDSGNIPEAETYLVNLWERDPQNGAVNLALARLFARQHLTQKAIQYYHNAMYGVWGQDSDGERENIRLETVHYLIGEKAFPDAQAELISWTAVLPANSELRLTLAELFAEAQDYEHALEEYKQVLRHGKKAAALAGAGKAAYRLEHYRTAQNYLTEAARAEPQNKEIKQMLDTSSAVLDADPFMRRISSKERNRRAESALAVSGKRLQDCASIHKIDLSAASNTAGLTPLYQRWLALKSKERKITSANAADARDSMMDLVFDIEQQTQCICGAPVGKDEALLLLSQNPLGVDR